MPRKLNLATSAPQAVEAAARTLGARIRLARQRRRVTVRELAGRAGVSYDTARAVESGQLATGIGAYVALIWALGLESEFAVLMDPDHDAEGKLLERARIPKRARGRAEATADVDF